MALLFDVCTMAVQLWVYLLTSEETKLHSYIPKSILDA